jgi:aspartyl-tRNA(Asn)/glutamyl-tRNA(Gln) amidotransferase subunit B
VLDALVEDGGDPRQIVEQKGLAAMDDSGELDSIVQAAIEADPDAVEQIKSGNQKAIGALMGAIMRETKGRADGQAVQRMIKEKIGA